MKRKRTMPRPRNGHVALMRLRKAGAHLKSRKAERRAETVALRRMDRDVPGRVNPSPSAPGRNAGVAERQTRRSQTPLSQDVGVQVPPPAPERRHGLCGSGGTADAAVLNTVAERCTGSSPVTRIIA